MIGTNQVKRSKGFTLIELMITIAVVAILVAMAVPAYKDFTIRAKVTECINGGAVAKIQVSEYRQALGEWPNSAAVAGISTPSGDSQFCTGFSGYDSGTGSFVIDIDEAAINSTLGTLAPVLTPDQLANGVINWACSAGVTAAGDIKYLPSSCRGS